MEKEESPVDTYMTDVCGFHVKNIPPGRETYEYRIAYISIYLCIYLSISISISIYHLYIIYISIYIYISMAFIRGS